MDGADGDDEGGGEPRRRRGSGGGGSAWAGSSQLPSFSQPTGTQAIASSQGLEKRRNKRSYKDRMRAMGVFD